MMTDREQVRFYIRLTLRKRQVLREVVRGLSNDEIADTLYIEPCVVADHLTHIYGELANEPAFAHLARSPKRTHLILAFAGFFERHPEYSEDRL